MPKALKHFAMRRNPADVAVGIVIGGALGALLDNVVADLLIPSLGLLLYDFDFSSLASASDAADLDYGTLAQGLAVFALVASAALLLLRATRAARQRKEATVFRPTTKACPYCGSTIPLNAGRCFHCTSQVS